MKTLFLSTVVLITLAGCMLDPRVRQARFQDACQAYGVRVGTFEMMRCMDYQERKWKAELNQSLESLGSASPALPRTQVNSVTINKSSPVSCTSYASGGAVYTNCR